MAEISVSVQAYCKMLLHAAKFPYNAVNGLLLAEDTKSKDSKCIKFVECIPLFHLSLGLSPMLEVALLQIDAYCRSSGLVVAGYYQANEHYNNKEMDNVAKTIGRKIVEHFPEACIFMIDNALISNKPVSEAYRIYSMKDNQWRMLEKRHTVDEDTLATTASLLKLDVCRKLIDFDNHLDNLKYDWRNLEINEMLSRCM